MKRKYRVCGYRCQNAKSDASKCHCVCEGKKHGKFNGEYERKKRQQYD